MKYTDIHLQRKVIEYVAARLPTEELYNPRPGQGKLEAILRAAKEDVIPYATTRCLRKWWNYFLVFGDVRPFIEKKKRMLNKRYGRTSTRGNWTPARTATLKRIIDRRPDLYLDEIQDQFHLETGELWSTSYLWRKLQVECGYSLQVATDRSTRRQQEDIDAFFDDLNRMVSDPSMLVFVDESAKDRNSSRRRRSWSRRGQTPFRQSYIATRDANRYTLIAACDINGFVVDACDTVLRERGDNDPDPTRGTVDGERFKQWVVDKLIPILGKYSNGEPRSVVVLDNASVHHVDGIVEAIAAAGAKVIFTAPYCPEYNPIETMFRVYKASLRRCRGADPHIHWLDAHCIGLESVTPAIARSLFRHAMVPGCEHFIDQEVTKEEEAMLYVSIMFIVFGIAKNTIVN